MGQDELIEKQTLHQSVLDELERFRAKVCHLEVREAENEAQKAEIQQQLASLMEELDLMTVRNISLEDELKRLGRVFVSDAPPMQDPQGLEASLVAIGASQRGSASDAQSVQSPLQRLEAYPVAVDGSEGGSDDGGNQEAAGR